MLKHKFSLCGIVLVAGFGLVLIAEPASAQRFGMYGGYARGYYGGAFPGYYGRPGGYGWGYPGYYGSSYLYPYSYGYSLYAPYIYTPYTTTGPTYYLPGGLTTGPYPTPMRPNSGSAGVGRTDDHGHLVVRLPNANAEIRINGQPTTESGKIRRYVSGRIRPGKKRTYKVTARWEENGNEVERTKTVVLRAGQHKTIRFTEATDQQGPAGRGAKPQGKEGARKTPMEKEQAEKKVGSKRPK
jgi:uncharacterized protein (TIGR03000 family)